MYTPILPIVHPTLSFRNSCLAIPERDHPSPFCYSFLFSLPFDRQRSSTYLLNNSPVPNLIAVRDTCNEIHQFTYFLESDDSFYPFRNTTFYDVSLTFLFVSSTIHVYILYVYHIRTILTYKLGIRNDLHRECNEPLQCHLKQKRKKPIFNLYTRDKV